MFFTVFNKRFIYNILIETYKNPTLLKTYRSAPTWKFVINFYKISAVFLKK